MFKDKAKDPAEQWTSEKVAAALELEQAKLEPTNGTDAGVTATYEAREREVGISTFIPWSIYTWRF